MHETRGPGAWTESKTREQRFRLGLICTLQGLPGLAGGAAVLTGLGVCKGVLDLGGRYRLLGTPWLAGAGLSFYELRTMVRETLHFSPRLVEVSDLGSLFLTCTMQVAAQILNLYPDACDCLGMLVLSGLPADQILGVVLTGRLP